MGSFCDFVWGMSVVIGVSVELFGIACTCRMLMIDRNSASLPELQWLMDRLLPRCLLSKPSPINDAPSNDAPINDAPIDDAPIDDAKKTD